MVAPSAEVRSFFTPPTPPSAESARHAPDAPFSQVHLFTGLLLSSCKMTQCAPGGLLYNHVSKTGGTSMKQMLHAASQTLGWPLLLPKTRNAQELAEAANPSQPLVVVQDDMRSFVLSEADAARYFVIGTVRPPCDYLLSQWSFRSDLLLRDTLHQTRSWHSVPVAEALRASPVSHLHGQLPPYTGADDLDRLRLWVTRAENVSLHHNLGLRYSANMLGRVHCWVQTQQLEAGVRRCLDEYAAACAIAEPTRAAALHRLARTLSKSHTQVSSAGTCTSYFTAAQRKEIMRRESRVLDLSRLGLSPATCCGTESLDRSKSAYRDQLTESLHRHRAASLHWAAEPNASFAQGFCRTVPPGEGDCVAGERGSWALSHDEVATIGAARACAGRCRACARCRAFSYSVKWMDCSWFHDCELTKLGREPRGFRTRLTSSSLSDV